MYITINGDEFTITYRLLRLVVSNIIELGVLIAFVVIGLAAGNAIGQWSQSFLLGTLVSLVFFVSGSAIYGVIQNWVKRKEVDTATKAVLQTLDLQYDNVVFENYRKFSARDRNGLYAQGFVHMVDFEYSGEWLKPPTWSANYYYKIVLI